jgi:hypothetical protein
LGGSRATDGNEKETGVVLPPLGSLMDGTLYKLKRMRDSNRLDVTKHYDKHMNALIKID